MKIKLILLFSILIFAVSCNVNIVPKRNAMAIDMVNTYENATASLYNRMIAANDKTYTTWQPDYTLIKNGMNEIKVLDESRLKNKIILKFINDIISRFTGYESDHQSAGTLNKSQLLTRRNGMLALWESLKNSENNFK